MANVEKLCVLFLYHKCDKLTLSHFEKLKESNPHIKIIPLTDSVSEYLPGTVDVNQFPSSWPTSCKWRNIDVTVYRWFEHREFDAEKYLFLEHDCLCTVDLVKLYESVWDSDVTVANYFSIAENPHWYYFRKRELARLPKEDLPYASGVSPFMGAMFSHSALKKYLSQVVPGDIFCELRLGTTIRKAGLNFKRLPLSVRKTICWHCYPWQANRPGLFHAIKLLDHNFKRKPEPGFILSVIYDVLRSRSPRRYLEPLKFPQSFTPRFLKRIMKKIYRKLSG